MNYKVCDLAKKHSSNGYILHIIFSREHLHDLLRAIFLSLFFNFHFNFVYILYVKFRAESIKSWASRFSFLREIIWSPLYKLGRQLLNTRQKDNLVGRGGRVFCFSVESTRFRWDCSRPQATFISGIGFTKSLFVWDCNIF